MSLVKIRDTISPDLLRKARAAADRKPLLRAMGSAALSLAVRSFTDPGLRPSTWAPRKIEPPKDGHAILQSLRPMLRPSLRELSCDNDMVTIGSDRPYAAAHQLGYPENNLPARPFLPFTQAGQLSAKGKVAVERALRAALKARGL
jgi:phage gpG-like protein